MNTTRAYRFVNIDGYFNTFEWLPFSNVNIYLMQIKKEIGQSMVVNDK